MMINIREYPGDMKLVIVGALRKRDRRHKLSVIISTMFGEQTLLAVLSR